MQEPPDISFVLPVKNEEESLEPLAGELRERIAAESLNAEIIFIDDGSTDGSWDKIAALARAHPDCHGIRFRRNFGKAAALAAGFARARGGIIIQMDADLQDDPVEIPNLLRELESGCDVVNGWKKTRYDPIHKTFPSRIFNWMINRLTGLSLHDHNCGYKCMRAEVVRGLTLYGEFHRFIPAMAHARGFKVVEMPVHHRARKFGRSKFGASRFLKGFLDLLTITFLYGFGQRPQHVLGGIGLAAFFVGSAGLGYLGVLWIIGERPIGNRPLLPYSVASLILGFLMLSMGMLAELIVAQGIRDRETYNVLETTEPD